MNEQNLVYLSTEEIYPHPDNPRKNLGDLSELVDSIKENGIFQNLTVVEGHWATEEEWIEVNKQDGVSKSIAKNTYEPKGLWQAEGYTVIIGHRRLAASKTAGLESVPCVVANMTETEQLRTMLMENMQRADLTPFEQAEGFQMMIDLGADIKTLAKDTGFSQATIKARLEWAKLDKDKFANAAARQISLTELNSLSKIEDINLRNKALEAIGTNNFASVYQDCLKEEEFVRCRKVWLEQLPAFAKEMPEEDRAHTWEKYSYITCISKWDPREFKRPEDADEKEYFFVEKDNEISLYSLKKESAQAEETPEEKERRAKQEIFVKKSAQAEALAEKHFKMRREFMRDFKPEMSKVPEMLRLSMDIVLKKAFEGDWLLIESELFSEVIGVDEFDDENEETFPYEQFKKRFKDAPGEIVAKVIYCLADKDDLDYTSSTWDNYRKLVWKDDEELNMVYEFLTALGYEMSDEEKDLQSGTHEIFKEENHG